ncbi:putative E3 ubiquitin-protein ligase LUL3 [Glycine soja]
MGISWSGNSRRRNNYLQNRPPPPSYYYPPESHPPPPPPPPPPPQSQGYFLPSTTPYAPPPPLPPPPGPPQSHSISFYYNSNPNSYGTPTLAPRFHFQHYYQPHPSACPAPRPASTTPPPYVDHQTAKKIRNYVNVHKDTLRLEVDDHNPDHHLLSFVFDAVYDGRGAGGECLSGFWARPMVSHFVVLVAAISLCPVRIPFQKGVGQKFAQPSGTGIDLGFFELDDLSKPSPGEDVFPLVICAETSLKTTSEDETPGDSLLDASPHMQITQGILEKSNGAGPFLIKVVKQILWIDGVRYELRELYGIGNSSTDDFDDNDPGKECVICMTEPKDTAVLPCRHMCMCSECANALRQQSNKCPICRQPIEELIEIKVNNGDQ